ncbi:hypothetical protein QQS21_003045 [Conoideocrella luteorostrata]|uniref:CMP/dCMP-type deaminase domain-containing protein n=1 Tax=Conoideocrella luteorostrata TaxID=1105319 RepID=A0AAJ0G0R2_9HYPO|nr:hypothetical protein QQS21_003045 [Conoideocrella luteorostrata]
MTTDTTLLLDVLLKTVKETLFPLTSTSGLESREASIFGSAILSCSRLELLTVATNEDHVSPLSHGEINCIQRFYTVNFPDSTSRPDSRECIFLSTHEPCSMCLSAIAWSGFRKVYFLFTYDETRDVFRIPEDIDIIKEVFQVKGTETDEQVKERDYYNRENKFFRSQSLKSLAESLCIEDRGTWMRQIEEVKELYTGLDKSHV